MAAFDYAKTRATAERLLARFGQQAIILRAGTGTGPAHNPGPATPTQHPCTAVVTDYRASERQGTEIEVNDRKILISTEGLAIAPATKDKITVGGKTFNLVNVKTLNPGGTALIYTAQGRL
jgi:hypothetical protein